MPSVPSYVPAGAQAAVQRLIDFKGREWPDPFNADMSFRSAVLVLVMPDEKGTGLDVVLTVRTTKMRRNAGEVACPGGGFTLGGNTAMRLKRGESWLTSFCLVRGDHVSLAPIRP